MKIKLRTLIIAWVIIILSMLWAIKASASFDDRVDRALSGGSVSTTTMPTWYLWEYKTTDLLRKSPMCWEPFQGYVICDQYVSITVKNNKNVLCFDADIRSMLKPDALYNRRFARAFRTSGTKRQQVRQIYNYCRRTTYTAHVKTARAVFRDRKGDCAGIASAFYVLCKAKGIPVRYVIGWTQTSCHAWNRVLLGSKWYWIDACHSMWLSERQYRGRTVMEIW